MAGSEPSCRAPREYQLSDLNSNDTLHRLAVSVHIKPMPNPARPPAPKLLNGKRQPITITLPPDLIAELDRVAAREVRSRGTMIEIILRSALRHLDGRAG
jgi:hypothetical protein